MTDERKDKDEVCEVNGSEGNFCCCYDNERAINRITNLLLDALILSQKMKRLINDIKQERNYVSVKYAPFEYCLESYVDNTNLLIDMLSNTTVWLKGETE